MSHALRILQLNSARVLNAEAAHTLCLTEALRQRGHSVFLGLREDYEPFELAKAGGLRPCSFKIHPRWWTAQNARDIQAIVNLVKLEKIDLIHAHRSKEHWLSVFANRMFNLRCPIVRTRHNLRPFTNHAANRWLARRTAAVVAVSTPVLNAVRDSALFDERKLELILPGVDLKKFSPATKERRQTVRAMLGIASDALVAICAPDFMSADAVHLLLSAWRLVQAKVPRACLILTTREQLDEHKVRAVQMNISRTVLFLNSWQDRAKLLDAADAGFCVNDVPSAASMLLEYMAAALPVTSVLSDTTDGLLEDGVHGKLAAPDDAESIATALSDVLGTDPRQRRNWGRAAYEKVEMQRGFHHWSVAHEKLYERLLADSRQKAHA